MELDCEDLELELQKGILYFLDFKEDAPNDEENMKKAFECFLKAAPYSAIAKHHLGLCYYYGLGTPVDKEKGISYNSDSAKEEYCVAIVKAFLRDHDDSYDGHQKEKATEQCTQLASKDDPFALFQLALIVAGNNISYMGTHNSVTYYLRAALLGHVIAQYNLGYRHRDGVGCSKDYGMAFKWIKIAAERGYHLAMTGLGGLYDFGKGVPQNFEEAVKWYQKATAKGEPMAFHNLGMSYMLGEGVDQDLAKAAEIFHQGSLAGNTDATHSYAKMLMTGNGIPKDEKKAFEYFTMAAEKDHTWSLYRLGLCYEDGVGTAVNWEQAKQWYLRGAQKHLGVASKSHARIIRKIENWPQMRLVWLGYLKNNFNDSTPLEERCMLSILPKDIIGEILKRIMLDKKKRS